MHRTVCKGSSSAHRLNFFNLRICSVKSCFCCADTQIRIQNDHFSTCAIVVRDRLESKLALLERKERLIPFSEQAAP